MSYVPRGPPRSNPSPPTHRNGDVILKAHDAGSGHVEVNRKLPADTIERFKEELHDVIRKRR
jgi:hypothetical protein